MMRIRAFALSVSLSLSLGPLTFGCGGGLPPIHLFATDWEDDHGASVEHARTLIGSGPSPSGADVVVGVSGHADVLVGLDLSSGNKWTFEHPLDARPAVAGHVVVLSGRREVVVLDASTGAKLWSRPTGGLPFLGAGDDGSVTVVSFGQRSARGSTLLAVLRDGTVVRQIETTENIGVPAVLHGHAFVPWANQYVSVIDLSNGAEVGRVVLREKVTRAFEQSGGLYFGELGFFRWDEHIRDASKGGASHVALPSRPLPGSPELMDPGNLPIAAIAGARDNVRLFARPSSDREGAMHVDGDIYYSAYFKVIVGLDAKRGHVRWASTHGSADVLGGSAIEGGFLGCDANGKLFGLRGRDGALAYEGDLGSPIQSCVVQADSFRLDAAKSEPKSLAEQLSEVVRSDDLRLAAEQRLLLQDLAKSPDELATKTIIDVASDSRAAPDLVKDARVALASRRVGVAYMKSALEKHYDYLHDVLAPPPVGPLADAIALVGDRSAAPLLAAHLLDPADTVDDARRVALALGKVGTKDELDALHQFIAMHRDVEDDDDLVSACGAAATALARIDGTSAARTYLDQVVADPMATPALREQLAASMRELDKAVAAADAGVANDSDAGTMPRAKKPAATK